MVESKARRGPRRKPLGTSREPPHSNVPGASQANPAHLVIIVDVAIETDPGDGWAKGPLELNWTDRRGNTTRSDAGSRATYSTVALSNLLYSKPNTSIRWHRAMEEPVPTTSFVCQAIEIVKLDLALGKEATGRPNGVGVIHGSVSGTSPHDLLAALRRAVNLHPINGKEVRKWISQHLPAGTSIVPANRQSVQVVLISADSRLERLFPSVDYERWDTVDQWLWALNHSVHTAPDPAIQDSFATGLLRPSAALRMYVGHQGLAAVVTANGIGAATEYAYTAFTVRTLFTDALVLGSLQRIAITELERQVYALLAGLTTASLTRVQDRLLSFRNTYWSVGFGYAGQVDRVLRGYQDAWRLQAKLSDLVQHLGEYAQQLQTRAADTVNLMVMLVTLFGVPVAIVVAIWAGTNRDWRGLVVWMVLGLTIGAVGLLIRFCVARWQGEGG